MAQNTPTQPSTRSYKVHTTTSKPTSTATHLIPIYSLAMWPQRILSELSFLAATQELELLWKYILRCVGLNAPVFLRYRF